MRAAAAVPERTANATWPASRFGCRQRPGAAAQGDADGRRREFPPPTDRYRSGETAQDTTER